MSSSPGNEAAGQQDEQAAAPPVSPDTAGSPASAPEPATGDTAGSHDSAAEQQPQTNQSAAPSPEPAAAPAAGATGDPAAGSAAAAGTAPDGSAPDGSAPAGGPDPAAIRTSLAQRFATAKSSGAAASEQPTAVAPGEADATSSPTTSLPAAPSPAAAGTGPAAGTPGTTPAAAAAGGGVPRPGVSAGPRRVRLALARIDPWSVMKLAFLLSIAVGIGIIVAAAAMWFVLDSMHVFSDIRDLLITLDSESFLTLLEYAEFDRVISMAAIVAVIDIFLLTALATLGAFLYNIVAALVGGLHLTLTDD